MRVSQQRESLEVNPTFPAIYAMEWCGSIAESQGSTLQGSTKLFGIPAACSILFAASLTASTTYPSNSLLCTCPCLHVFRGMNTAGLH